MASRPGRLDLETRKARSHQIGIILGEIAALTRRRADRDPKAVEILGTISDLLDCVSAPAVKGTKTRAKNDEQESAQVPAKENGVSVPVAP